MPDALASAASATATALPVDASTNPLLALATEPLFGLPLAALWFVVVFWFLATFLVLDGFDFGAGILFAFRDDHDDRETILAAIGPFWDGNEVWLVVFGGGLFAAFPAVYANLFSRHYLLMFGVLGALILRGLAPEFYEQRHDAAWQAWWGRAFVAGSTLAPFLLGWFAGVWLVGSGTLSIAGPATGALVVALCLLNGATFLATKTTGSLRNANRAYGQRAAALVIALVLVVLAYVALATEYTADLFAPTSLAAVTIAVVALAASVTRLRADAPLQAFAAAGTVTYCVVALVALLMYPLVDPATGLRVDAAIVSTLPLNLMTIAAAFLMPLVLAYFAVLYSTFSGPVEAGDAY